jgi:integrase
VRVATLRKRGQDTWQLVAYAGIDNRTGKQRQVTRTVHGSEREARRALNRFATDVEDQKVQAASGTFGEQLEDWIRRGRDRKGKPWSPKTKANVRGWADNYIKPQLGGLPLRKVSAAAIADMYDELLTRGRAGHPLSCSTVHRVHNVVHRALEDAVRRGRLAVNPAHLVDAPQVGTRAVAPPSAHEVDKLILTATEEDPTFGAFLELAASIGARRGELLALRWKDINFDPDNPRVEIARNAVWTRPSGLVIKPPKTGERRWVSLDDASVDALCAARNLAVEQANAIGIELAADAYVFGLLPWTEPWRPDSVTQRFHRLCARLGVSGVRLHDLRHHSATTLLTHGVDVRTVAGRLGHRSAKMTLDVYGHFMPAADLEAARVLSERTRVRRRA